MGDDHGVGAQALTFYEVELFLPGYLSLRVVCPACLRGWEFGGRRLRVAAELPADEDEPRTCSNCERPQLGYWSRLERWAAEWDAGVRLAGAEGPPF
jgi:hypothetical protein